jgi:DNA-binding FadR family transcriptional regulator
LEPFVAEKVARIIKKDQLEKLWGIVKESDSVLKKDPSNGSDIEFHQFHQILADLSGNPILSFVVDFVENLMLDIRNSLGGNTDFSRKVQRTGPHKRIYKALVKGDPQKAREEMRKHVLQVERGLLALKRRKGSRIVRRRGNRLQTRLSHGNFLKSI